VELRGVRLLIAITISVVIQAYNFFAFLKKRPGKLTKADNFTMYFWRFLLFFTTLVQFTDLKFWSTKFFIDIFLFLHMLGHDNGR
jgi:hypothetical protein